MKNDYDPLNPLLVSSELLLGSLQAAQQLNVDLSESITISGIDPAVLVCPRGYLPLHQVVNFLNDVADRHDCPEFGFLVAKHQPPLRFSYIGQLVKFAANLEQAIDDALRFSLLNSEFSDWRLVRENGMSILIRRTRVRYAAPMVQMQLLSVTLVYKALLNLCGRKLRINQISFSHSSSRDKSHYERYFGAPVLFNSEFDGIAFPDSCLGITLDTADTEVHRLLTSQLKTLAQGLPQHEDIVGRTLHHIKESIGSNRCNLESVAQVLGQHPRNLQRELKKSGATFRDLLTDVRQELAEKYLRDSSLSIVDLSDMLGYRNPSAFSRAFKQAAGLSPQHWKSKHS